MMGGLGNQMFQYAFGLVISKKLNQDFFFDLSFYEDQTERYDFTPRKLALNIFGLKLPQVSKSEISKFYRVIKPTTFTDKIYRSISGRKYYLENGPHYDENVDKITNNTYCEGYFQDEKYFDNASEEIRGVFKFENDRYLYDRKILQLYKEITSSVSVCIHIRRGDYITNPTNAKIFGTLSKGYYLKAIDHIEKTINSKTKKYIFSNDPKWCQETFSGYSDITIIDENYSGPNGTTHFWLMTKCKHFIIANSSFSWWAAWLGNNPNKIICRPFPWFINNEFKSASVCPDSWFKISRQ